jgi:hypothetical protein
LILLDENTLRSQVELLEARRLPVHKVGRNWGRRGMTDQEILVELRRARRVTFFTTDAGFYHRPYCHPRYCLAVVAAPAEQVAAYALRVLRHPALRTHALRMGKVVRAQPTGIVYWEWKSTREIVMAWSA